MVMMFSLKRKPKVEPGMCECTIYPMRHHESWCEITLHDDQWSVLPYVLDEWAAKS